ncbi:MAG TPA: hypothetical protein VGJ94_10560 [Syntrophorhabdaceae bacterium]|jgi:hypothetical protein
MKINLTKSQFETLLKTVYLGNWVAASAGEEADREFEDFEQYVLSLAKDFGYEAFAGFDEKEKTYYPTEEFEEKTGVVDTIGDYNMHTVWEEMVLSLARRDLIGQYGEDRVEKMSDDEIVEKEYPFIVKYEEEFRESGFQNLVITKKGLRLA